MKRASPAGLLIVAVLTLFSTRPAAAQEPTWRSWEAGLQEAEASGPRPRSAPASTPAAAGGGGGGDVVTRLKDLQELRKSGAITEEEFQKLKAEILGGK